MNIETDLFKKTTVDYKKLLNYGFQKENNNYVYEKKFLDDNFKAIITVLDKGNVSGKVIDLEMNEEYLGLRTKITGEFASAVREAYKEILVDIKKHCFITNCFISNQANKINEYIKDKYSNEPEFLWSKFPTYGVYRNKNNHKWYAIIMNLDFSKLDNKTGEVEIINVKLNPEKIKDLLKRKGFYRAYHMNKKDWITIMLNNTLEDETVFSLIDESFNLININN